MDAVGGGEDRVIEFVGNDFFPSQVNEAVPPPPQQQQQQRQHNGNDGGGGGGGGGLVETAVVQPAVKSFSWQGLEAYVHSDAAVSSLRSYSWIAAPSAAVRRRRWRLVNCMRQKSPPISIQITDDAPREFRITSMPHQTREEPPSESNHFVGSWSSSPWNTVDADSINASALEQRSFLRGARERENITVSDTPLRASANAGAETVLGHPHHATLESSSEGAGYATRQSLSTMPYLANTFSGHTFAPECRQLLAELSPGAEVNEWAVFVVAATLRLFQKQALAWATSWWGQAAELSDGRGRAFDGWLMAPKAGASVNQGILDEAGSRPSSTTDTIGTLSPYTSALGVLCDVRRLLFWLLYTLCGAVCAGLRACAGLIGLDNFSLPVEGSMLESLSTDEMWRLQVEVMLACTALILLIVCALVFQLYHKYTFTLELWEAEMLRRDAEEAEQWTAQMKARQERRHTSTPTVATNIRSDTERTPSGDRGKDCDTSATSLRRSNTVPMSHGGLRGLLAPEEPGDLATLQGGSSWCADVEVELNGGNAFSLYSQSSSPESNDGEMDNAWDTSSFDGLPENACRDAPACGTNAVEIKAGTVRRRLPFLAPPTSTSPLLASIRGQRQGGDGTLFSGSTQYDEVVDSTGCLWQASLPLKAEVSRGARVSGGLTNKKQSGMNAARPKMVSIAERHAASLMKGIDARRIQSDRSVQSFKPVPSVFIASPCVSESAMISADPDTAVKASSASLAGTSPALATAVTEATICLDSHRGRLPIVPTDLGAHSSEVAEREEDHECGVDGAQTLYSSPHLENRILDDSLARLRRNSTAVFTDGRASHIQHFPESPFEESMKNEPPMDIRDDV